MAPDMLTCESLAAVFGQFQRMIAKINILTMWQRRTREHVLLFYYRGSFKAN